VPGWKGNTEQGSETSPCMDNLDNLDSKQGHGQLGEWVMPYHRILPGVTLEDGVAVGALGLVNRDCKAFGVYCGISAKRIKERKRDLLILEKQFSASKAR